MKKNLLTEELFRIHRMMGLNESLISEESNIVGTYADMNKGVIINVDLSNGYKDRLVNWLSTEHKDIFSTLDYHEGGDVSVSEDEIVFSGDNGIFIMDRINIKTI